MNISAQQHELCETSWHDEFEIVYPKGNGGPALVIMKASEPPFSLLTELQEALRTARYVGPVLIDQLLHTGNSDARFVSGFFDEESFDKSRFRIQSVDADSPLRRPMCEFLRSDPETRSIAAFQPGTRRALQTAPTYNKGRSYACCNMRLRPLNNTNELFRRPLPEELEAFGSTSGGCTDALLPPSLRA